MNSIRESVYYNIKSKGYHLINYTSSKAITCNTKFGDDCFILAGNILQPFTTIGNNVMLWSSNFVAHHSVIKDHVTFAARCTVGKNSYLGKNSTVRDGTILAKGTLVGIATVITKNTEEWSVYIGNPAKKIGKNISKSILKI